MSLKIMYIFLLFFHLSYAIVKHKNYTLYEVTAFNNRERAVLYQLSVKNDVVIFLNGVTNEAAVAINVLVDGCCLRDFEKKLRDNDIEYNKIRDDFVYNQINAPKPTQTEQTPVRVPNITTDFHTWERLRLWVEHKKRIFTTLKKIVIGNTYEKREIFILKISTGKKNTAVFLLGGEEGRDWISPAILFNFVNYMLENNNHMGMLLKHYDFYVLPVLNPDGYEYSMKMDRYWSKNRKAFYPQKSCRTTKELAVGVNIDRNWFLNKASLGDECNSVYTGAKPLSEEETRALSRFLDSIAMNMMVFINVRGFERLITMPYGYTNLKSANNYAILMDILSSVKSNLKEEHNVTFNYGIAANYFYNFSGNCADWVKENLNIPVVYTIYMKLQDLPLPVTNDIQPLICQFTHIIKNILFLANNIYGPIFNNQITLYNYSPATFICSTIGLYILKIML